MLEAMAKNINASPRMAEKLNKSDKSNTGKSSLYLFSPNGKKSGEKKRCYSTDKMLFMYRSQILNRRETGKQVC